MEPGNSNADGRWDLPMIMEFERASAIAISVQMLWSSSLAEQKTFKNGTTPVGCRGGNRYVEGEPLTFGYLLLDDSLGYPHYRLINVG